MSETTAVLNGYIRELQKQLQQHCFSHGDFGLASGRRSNFFYNGKRVTLSPEGQVAIGHLIYDVLKTVDVAAVGGKTLGADAIATAVSYTSALYGQSLPTFIVRAGQKDHGKKDLIAEAHSPDDRPLICPGRRVAIVDDVATTGGSCLEAIEAVEAVGAVVVIIVVLVDRQEGAAENFRQRGYDFRPLYHADAKGQLTPSPYLLSIAGSAA